MKEVFTILLFILFSKWSYTQNSKTNLSDSTSNIIKNLSYFWIKDSLANNGFRLYSYERILKSKIDAVTSDSLVKKLGKPNETRNTNHGFELWYYVYDSNAMPKEFGRPFECLVIAFMFRNGNKALYDISDTVLDY
ncbi:MAG: hypothetical protein EOO53_21045 [Gammaproteobacteria bacterium]|nr:MAG: hypothetical protein EOO53_21045 [Gammaproteobacteria bacterium]